MATKMKLALVFPFLYQSEPKCELKIGHQSGK